jgi:hypothetical protein
MASDAAMRAGPAVAEALGGPAGLRATDTQSCRHDLPDGLGVDDGGRRRRTVGVCGMLRVPVAAVAAVPAVAVASAVPASTFAGAVRSVMVVTAVVAAGVPVVVHRSPVVSLCHDIS